MYKYIINNVPVMGELDRYCQFLCNFIWNICYWRLVCVQRSLLYKILFVLFSSDAADAAAAAVKILDNVCRLFRLIWVIGESVSGFAALSTVHCWRGPVDSCRWKLVAAFVLSLMQAGPSDSMLCVAEQSLFRALAPCALRGCKNRPAVFPGRML